MSEVESILRTLLPEDVEIAAAPLDFCPWPTPYPIELGAVTRSVKSRLNEFSAGRYLARKALASLGVPAQPIPVGKMRAPVWPTNVTGSITHGGNICAACVGWQTHYQGLGIDCEAARDLEPALQRMIMHPADAGFQEDDAVAPPNLWPVLIFSIKEAAFKAYFSLMPEFLGFEDLSVQLVSKGRFRVETKGRAALAIQIDCRAAWNEGRVFSAAWIGASPSGTSTVASGPL